MCCSTPSGHQVSVEWQRCTCVKVRTLWISVAVVTALLPRLKSSRGVATLSRLSFNVPGGPLKIFWPIQKMHPSSFRHNRAQVSDNGGRILPLTWPVWSSSWLLSSCFSCVVINVYSTWQPVVSDHNCFRSVVNAANCYAITWHPTGALFTRETQNFPQRSLRHKVRKRAKIAPSVPSCWGTTSAVRCGRNSADGQTT